MCSFIVFSKWKADRAAVTSLCVSPDGKLLLSAGHTIKMWDLATKELYRVSVTAFLMHDTNGSIFLESIKLLCQSEGSNLKSTNSGWAINLLLPATGDVFVPCGGGGGICILTMATHVKSTNVMLFWQYII